MRAAPTPYRSRVLKLDELCRRVVMVRAGAAEFTEGSRVSWRGRCERCGKVAWLQWAHFRSRAIHATRWDLDNSVALDAGCHFTWAHHRPDAFTEWMKRRLGDRRYRALAMRAGSGGRRPDPGLVELHLKAELDALTGRTR